MISKGLMRSRLTAGNTGRPVGNIGRVAALIPLLPDLPDTGYRPITYNL